MNTFNKMINDYIAFYTNGEKVRITSDTEDGAYEQAHEKCPDNAELDFVTHSATDFPFDFDWDGRLKVWQSRIF